MRPLSLRIEGLRSFRASVEIDFGDRDQIAVVGDTGAGKSSILEAMTYALYGKTSFAGQANQELMNDTSDKTRVVLRFRVSGQEWDVVRTLRRDGKGQVRPSGARLQLLGKDGEPLEIVEQVRQVNERVEQLIGLDSDAFLRTVVLPQGRFARLLVEDRPADRGKVLRQLWPTEDLEAVGELASWALGDVGQTRARLEQEAEAHPEDPEAHLAQLRKHAASAQERADAAAALAEEASRAFGSLEAAIETGRRAAAEIGRVEPGLSRIEEAEVQVAPVQKVEREIEKADGELRGKQAGLREQLDRIPSEDGPDQGEVTTALIALQRFASLASAAVEAAGEMRRKATAAQAKREAAGQAKEAAEKATKEAQRHAQLRPPLAEAEETARTRREEARLAHQKCDGLRRGAEEAQKKVAELADRQAELATKDGNAVAEAEKAKAAAADAEGKLADARRANSAAAAARGLQPGDDCPVCRRDLPAGWVPPEDAGLADAETAAGQARAVADERGRQAASASAEKQSAEKHLSDAQASAKEALAEYSRAVKELAAAFGPAATFGPASTAGPASDDVPVAGAPRLPSLDSLIGPLEAAHQKASAALIQHDDEQKALDAEGARLSNEAATAEAEAKGADELATVARQGAVDALARLARNVGEAPSPYRPRVDLPSDPAELDKVDQSAADSPIAEAQKRQHVLAEREQQRLRLNRELEEAGKAREDLAQRRLTEVEQPLSAIVGTLGSHRDTMLRAVAALALGDALGTVADVPSAPSGKGPAAHQEWMRGLRSLTSALVEAARARVKEAAEAEQVARDALAEVGRQLVAQAADDLSLDAEAESVGTPALQLLDGPEPAAGSEPPTDTEPPAGPELLAGSEPLAAPEPRAGPEPPATPEAVVARTAEARRDADHAARNAARERDAFAAIKDDVLALRALLDEADELERALSDLDKALKPGAFLKWLTLRRSRSLLVQASRMLGEISGGKYSFVDPGDDEGQWRVLDEESGQPRSPASLSGGEQFIASLALALGMVEMMARAGGRLESLFLDEGFGSLDRGNLDSAVEALGTVAATGRMVGVISHVRAVAEQLDHVLEVERTAAGSRAKWLSRDQRRRTSRSDAEREASAAMEGLLE